jgi:hypothetical protein
MDGFSGNGCRLPVSVGSSYWRYAWSTRRPLLTFNAAFSLWNALTEVITT